MGGRAACRNGTSGICHRTLPPQRNGTVYEAVAVRYRIMHTAIRHMIIVTDDYHTHRALAIFTFVLLNEATEIMSAPRADQLLDD